MRLLKMLALSSFVIFTFTQTSAQTIFAELPTDKPRIGDFDAIVYGDSLFFSYEEKTVNGPVLRARWIREGKTSPEISLASPISFIHPTNGQAYLYTVEQRKSATILQRYSATTLQVMPPLSLTPGILLGAYSEKNLFVVIYQRDQNVVTVHELDGDQEVSKRNYPVPDDLRIWIRKESNVEFIEHTNSQINTFKGYSRVKLIHQDHLYLTLDNHMRNESLVVTLRADGTFDHSIFPVNSTDDFGTFILDGKLFMTIMSNKKFVMNITDLESKKLIASGAIEKGAEEIEVYFRSTRYKFVAKESFKKLMNVAGMGDPQLTVSHDSANYIISWGSFIDDKGVGAPGGASPIGILVSLAVSTAIKQMSEGPGISRQFFYKFNEKTLQFSNDMQISSYPRVKLDEYEIEQQNQGVKIKSKYYVPYKNGLLAIYNLSKEDIVRMVVFE